MLNILNGDIIGDVGVFALREVFGYKGDATVTDVSVFFLEVKLLEPEDAVVAFGLKPAVKEFVLLPEVCKVVDAVVLLAV